MKIGSMRLRNCFFRAASWISGEVCTIQYTSLFTPWSRTHHGGGGDGRVVARVDGGDIFSTPVTTNTNLAACIVGWAEVESICRRLRFVYHHLEASCGVWYFDC